MTLDAARALLQFAAGLCEPLDRIRQDPKALVSLIDLAGWDLAETGLNPQELVHLAEDLGGVIEKVRALDPDKGVSFDWVVALVPDLVDAAENIASFGAGASSPPGLPGDIATQFVEDMFGNLADVALWHARPALRSALELLGVLTHIPREQIATASGRLVRAKCNSPRLDFDALARWFEDPAEQALAAIGLGATSSMPLDQAAYGVFAPWAALLRDLGVDAWAGARQTQGPQTTDPRQELLQRSMVVALPSIAGISEIDLPRVRLFLSLFERPDGARELVVVPRGDIRFDWLVGNWRSSLIVEGQPEGLALRCDGADFQGGSAALSVEAAVAREDGSNPLLQFGTPSSASIQLGDLSLHLRLELAEAEPHVSVRFAVALKALALAIRPPPGDGFLGSVLPADGVGAGGDLTVAWDGKGPLRFEGAAGLKYSRSVKKKLGPIEVENLKLEISSSEDGLEFAAGLGLNLSLGPVRTSIDGIGLRLAIGRHFECDFQPPNVIGLSIDTAVVKGSGFIQLQPGIAQYSGFFQLSIKETIDVQVIGILNARLPGGRPGYSLLLMITGEFPPIQLGLGFTLNGIGGLIGINRTAAVDVLRTGLRTGALNSILFPSDTLSNVPALLNTLGSVFPVAEGRYVFGPMAKLGWGSPTILTLDLALILEIPDPVRLLVLGRLKATLPNEKDAVVLLRMDALGVLDFNRSEFSLDATLYDSRILTFPLSGDMAMRLSWGATPNFLFSVGGFHPHYQPPAGMPKLARLAIVFVDSAEARLRLDNYFALTSNTVQFGARAEAFLKLDIVEARGFVSFDALFHFSPFTLEAELAAAVAIAVGGVTLLGADLALTLTGPKPWHLFGEASFAILGIKGTAPVDLRIGDSDPPPEQLPDPVDVFAMLKAALADSRNWQTQLPDSSTFAVSLRPPTERETAAGAPMLAHPLGTISVRQRVVPLMLAIRRYGNAPIQGASFFCASFLLVDGRSLDVDGTPIESELLWEQFALAQYQNLSDEQKLAGPSFSAQPAGLIVADTTFVSSPKVSIPPADAFDGLQRMPATALGPTVLSSPPHRERVEWCISMGAAARSPSRTTGAARYFAAASPTRRPGASLHV